jgi:aldehyde dehydrogenase (NAD+)
LNGNSNIISLADILPITATRLDNPMSIETIFDTMEYGTAPEDRSVALQWIADRGGLLGPYVNGAFSPGRDDLAICNPATGEKLAGISLCTKDEVTEAVRSARAAQPGWQTAGGPARARVLYALARLMQKHARLLAVMESLDNGKPIRESRDIDIPLAIRHFYHHAGHAQLMPSALSDRVALGVCGQIIPWNFPLLMLAWKIAPALAMGNTVVLKPAEYTPMTAMIFADLCSQAGVPPGVVNIVTGDGSTGAALVDAYVD